MPLVRSGIEARRARRAAPRAAVARARETSALARRLGARRALRAGLRAREDLRARQADIAGVAAAVGRRPVAGGAAPVARLRDAVALPLAVLAAIDVDEALLTGAAR